MAPFTERVSRCSDKRLCMKLIPDTVCFVDSYSDQLALLMDSSQDFPNILHSQKLRRNIEEPCIRMPTF